MVKIVQIFMLKLGKKTGFFLTLFQELKTLENVSTKICNFYIFLRFVN